MVALRVSLHLMGALTGHPRWPLGKVLPAAWGGSAHWLGCRRVVALHAESGWVGCADGFSILLWHDGTCAWLWVGAGSHGVWVKVLAGRWVRVRGSM
jgi:hypothetical protein